MVRLASAANRLQAHLQKVKMAATDAAKLALCRRLALRESPGFTATVMGTPLPLRAVSNVDGFGRLDLMFYFSDHAGVAALRPWAERFLIPDPEKNAAELARIESGHIWAVATEPTHDPADRAELSATQLAFKPEQCDAEIAAMVAAGLIRPLGRTSRSHAPLFEVCDMESWAEVVFPPDEDDESDEEADD